MTEQMTKNDIMRLSAYGKVFYTKQSVKGLNHLNMVGYNSGVYGWNFDVYELGVDVLLIGDRVPSYAEYIEQDEIENYIIEQLELKIESMDIAKERLILEVQTLKENKNKNF